MQRYFWELGRNDEWMKSTEDFFSHQMASKSYMNDGCDVKMQTQKGPITNSLQASKAYVL